MQSRFEPSSQAEFTRRAEDLFFAAMDLDLGNRRSFISEKCGSNRQLRDCVWELIDCHERNQSGDFILDRPLMPGHSASTNPAVADIAEREGDTIGRYRLIEKIGEGGMGVVYLAQQLADVNRRVALKVIKLGMDTRQVIARFETERQAMAMFDHPNITRVFDAGTTAAGRPYFVMELIHGTEINQYTADHRLDLHQRLKLFVTICHAVQHAHQKGIIHRDLKPSNILIAHLDGVPTPKIIDFGIAKALDHRLASEPSLTHYAMMIGTPQYMSPEQAEANGIDIDTRADIYSLGVLLYELITGNTPPRRESLNRLTPAALIETIRQHEVDTPRSRVAGQMSRDIRYHSGPPKVRWSSLGERELGCIVIKAVAHDRSQRYQSATELAADIERYLNGDPVEAVAPTRLYRLRTYVSKNRKSVVAIVAIGLTLVLSTIVCSVLAIHAVRASRDKDRTVTQLRATLSELNTKHEKLLNAESQIRATAEAQMYQSAIEMTFARFGGKFGLQVASLFPTFVEHDTSSEDSLNSTQNGRRIGMQVVPHGSLNRFTLIDLTHRKLVAEEVRRLETCLLDIRRFESQIQDPPNESTETDLKRQALIAQKTIEMRPDFFRLLLAEYRATFGEQDPRVAGALNLLAAALIEANQHQEAEAYLGEALALTDDSEANQSSRQLLELARLYER